jgi:hypothetical protein
MPRASELAAQNRINVAWNAAVEQARRERRAS